MFSTGASVHVPKRMFRLHVSFLERVHSGDIAIENGAGLKMYFRLKNGKVSIAMFTGGYELVITR